MKSKIKRLLSEQKENETVDKKTQLLEKALKAKTIKELKAIVIELIKKIR